MGLTQPSTLSMQNQWVASAHSPHSGMKFRFLPESSYSPSVFFSAASSGLRPDIGIPFRFP